MSDLTEKLRYIPSDDYDTWLTVGMALKHEGYGWEVWRGSGAASTSATLVSQRRAAPSTISHVSTGGRTITARN